MIDPRHETTASPDAETQAERRGPSRSSRHGWAYFYWRWSLPLFLLLGLWLRLPGMSQERGFWQDEGYSLLYSWNAHGYQPRAFPPGSSPTIYSYFTSWLAFRAGGWLATFGHPPLIRLPFLLFGLCSIAAGWGLGRVWRHPWISATLAAWLALWPFKAHWDLSVRMYALMMLGCMTLYLGLEAFRRRRSWTRLFLLLPAVYLAPLNSIQGLPLFAIPGCYLLWLAGADFVTLCRHRGHAARGCRWHRILLGRTLKLVPIALVMLASLATSLGWKPLVERGPRMLGAFVTVAAYPPAKARITGAASFSKPTEKGSGIQSLVHEFVRRNSSVRWLTPASWMMIGGRTDYIETLLFYRPETHTYPGDSIQLTWYLFFVIGFVVLLRRSPPLLISALAIAGCVGCMLESQEQVENYSPRYYTLAMLALCLIACVGLGGLAKMLLQRLPRRLPMTWASRSLRWGLVLLIAVTFAPGLASLARSARLAAGDNVQYLSQVYGQLRARYPEGIMFKGYRPEDQQLAQALDILAYHRNPHADPHGSPLRNSWENFAPGPIEMQALGLGFVEQAQRYSAAVIYNWGGMNRAPARMAPFMEQLLRPSAVQMQHPVCWREVDFTDRAFITRGKLLLPLRATFEQGTSSSTQRSTYRWRQLFEVPGRYRLTLSGQASNPPTPLVLSDGQTVNWTTTSLQGLQAARRRQPVQPHWRQQWQIFVHPDMATLPDPLPNANEIGWATEFFSPNQPFADQQAELSFAASALQPRSQLLWEYMGPAPTLRAPGYEVLPPVLWNTTSTLHISAPVRLLNASLPAFKWVLIELEPQAGRITERDNLLSQPQIYTRAWQAGDLLMPGSFEIDSSLLKRVIGHRLALLVDPRGPNELKPLDTSRLVQMGSRTLPILLKLRITPAEGRMNVELD